MTAPALRPRTEASCSHNGAIGGPQVGVDRK
jgi:hypothetical protein